MPDSLIPFVENCYFLKRKDSTLIACLVDGGEVPLIKFKQKFIDIDILDRQPREYMLKYMELFPDLWEYVKEEKQQLTLF